MGSIVQGGIGLGVGLVATPVATLLYPSMMPGAVLVLSALLPVFTLVREWRQVDWRGLSWALGGRVAGTPVGVAVVALLSTRAIGVLVGGIVLAALGVSALTSRVPRNPGTLVAAGAMAGAMGTATSISGPPLALLYQRDAGSRVRATLALFFSLGALLSLCILAATGQMPVRQVYGGLALSPFVLVGFLLSGPLRRHLVGGRMRVAVLIVVGTSAAVLLVRSLWF